MQLKEMESRVLKLLDDQNPKEDVRQRLRLFVDMGQEAVAMHYPIWREKEYTAETPRKKPEDCREAAQVRLGDRLLCWDPEAEFDGLPDRFCLIYKAFPAGVGPDTELDTELDTPREACQAVILYAAAKLQEMDFDQGPFRNFLAEYQAEIAALSQKLSRVAVVDDDGIDI